MVLSDGRKLLEVWPEATMFDREGEALRFVSIPEGSNGQVFVEYGSGEDRGVSLYQFYQNGEADFYMGLGTASKKR